MLDWDALSLVRCDAETVLITALVQWCDSTFMRRGEGEEGAGERFRALFCAGDSLGVCLRVREGRREGNERAREEGREGRLKRKKKRGDVREGREEGEVMRVREGREKGKVMRKRGRGRRQGRWKGRRIESREKGKWLKFHASNLVKVDLERHTRQVHTIFARPRAPHDSKIFQRRQIRGRGSPLSLPRPDVTARDTDGEEKAAATRNDRACGTAMIGERKRVKGASTHELFLASRAAWQVA